MSGTRTVPKYYFILKVPGQDRSITVVHQTGTVLNIFLDPPGIGTGKIRSNISSLFPGILEKGHPRMKMQLTSYFTAKRRKFTVPCDISGLTPFQRKVLKAAGRIHPGRTCSYSGLARLIGHPAACRAVGAALASNPVPILIPCHRVVRADGSTGGFMSADQDKTGWKRFLLELENG